MNDQLDELLAILHRETELHEMLLDLLRDEAEGFGTLSGSAMLTLQSRKLQHTRMISKLERRRIQLVEEMADDFTAAEESLTLSEIIFQAPTEWAAPLQSCFDRLKEMIAQIREQAASNSEQSASRLKSVEASLQFISKQQGAQQLYSGNGRLHTSASKISRAAI